MGFLVAIFPLDKLKWTGTSFNNSAREDIQNFQIWYRNASEEMREKPGFTFSDMPYRGIQYLDWILQKIRSREYYFNDSDRYELYRQFGRQFVNVWLTMDIWYAVWDTKKAISTLSDVKLWSELHEIALAKRRENPIKMHRDGNIATEISPADVDTTIDDINTLLEDKYEARSSTNTRNIIIGLGVAGVAFFLGKKFLFK